MRRSVVKNRCFIIAFVLFGLITNAQYSTTTIIKAQVFGGNYLNGNVYGIATNGDTYNISFVNHYDANGNPTSVEVVRADLTNHTSTSKIINHLSSTSLLWQSAMDSNGHVYFGLNSAGRRIWHFNFKDSIFEEDLGNGFDDNNSLAYSISLGSDRNMYFGASSGADTYVSMYNTSTHQWTSYGGVNGSQHYVLAIAGTSNHIYVVLGEIGNELWDINKTTGVKTKIFQIGGRMSLHCGSDGFGYVQFSSDTLSGTWKLNGTTATSIPSYNNITFTDYKEVAPNGFEPWNGKPYIGTAYYDDASDQLFYSLSGAPTDSVSIPAGTHIRKNIRTLFSFLNDANNIWLIGDYYALYYRYNLIDDSSYAIGSTGFNIYSTLQKSDSEQWLGNYPSATVLLYNKNQPWTVGKSQSNANSTTNPKAVVAFRTATDAQMHYAAQMVINGSYLVSAGDVIRIDNTCSIASYNLTTHTAQGYDYNKIDNLTFVSLANWNDKVLMSTLGASPKIYVYEPATNSMLDSLSFGLFNYGKLYVNGNTLVGVTPTVIYKYDLHAKTLIESHNYSGIITSEQLSDGRIVIEMGSDTPPSSIWNFVKLPYTYAGFKECNKILYTVNGIDLVKINGIASTDDHYDTNSAWGRYIYLRASRN